MLCCWIRLWFKRHYNSLKASHFSHQWLNWIASWWRSWLPSSTQKEKPGRQQKLLLYTRYMIRTLVRAIICNNITLLRRSLLPTILQYNSCNDSPTYKQWMPIINRILWAGFQQLKHWFCLDVYLFNKVERNNRYWPKFIRLNSTSIP